MKRIKLLPYFFVTLGFLLSQVMAFEIQNVYAKEYINYETFVHLNNDAKKEVVLMVMEYAVTLDSATEKDPKIYQNKKYSLKLFKKIWNQMMISEAYAQDGSTEELCIYGGWLSLMVNGKCTHPYNIREGGSGKNAGVFRATLDKITDETTKNKLISSSKEYMEAYNKNSECKPTEGITCSPKFFGTQNDGTPFCVSGNKGKEIEKYGANSSLHCMQKVKKSPDREEILQRLVTKALEEDNKAAFSELLKMMYSTCMCKNGDYINQGYADRIFDHRTCYGIIMQTQSILGKMFDSENRVNSCTALVSETYANGLATMADFATDAYKKINDRFSEDDYNAIAALTTDSDIDVEFKKLREQDLNNFIENGTCPLDFPGIELSQKKHAEKENVVIVTATLKGLKANESKDKVIWNYPEDKNIEKVNEIELLVPQGPEEILIKADFLGTKTEILVPALTKEDEEEKTRSCSISLLESKKEAEAGTEAKTQEAEKEKKEEPTSFMLTFDFETEEKITWSGAPKLSENFKTAIYKDYKKETIKVTIGEISCEYSETVPEDPKTDDDTLKGITIAAKKTSNTNDKSVITATLSKDGKELELPAGHTIRWYKKDVKTVDKKEDKKKKDEEEKKKDLGFIESEEATSSGDEKLGDGKEVSVNRDLTTDQKVYAKLFKGDKEVAKSSEVQVDKKKSIPKNLNNSPNMPNAVQPNLFRKGLGGQRGVF